MTEPPARRTHYLRRAAVVPVIIAAVAVLVVCWRPLYTLVSDRDRVRAWVEGWGPWGPLVVILLEMAQTLLAPIPGQAVEAVSGYLYGPWLGSLYPMIGMAIGSTLTFGLSRRFGRPLVVKLVGRSSMAKLDDLARRGGTPFFFLIWLLPFAPDDLACVAAGLTPMPFRRFVPLMLLGRWPGVFASALVGANIVHITPSGWAVLLAAVACVGLALWRWGPRVQTAVLDWIERLLS